MRVLKLNFHHLYYFYVIAEERQIARAAKRLRIGQPALSTQLKSLESFLGYQIIHRKRGQALALTKHGEILYVYCKEIFRLADEMLSAASGLKTETTLHLRIGALDWLPKHEVSELVAVILQQFDCFVSIFEDSAANLMNMLTEHKLDLVITNTPAPHSEAAPLRAHRIALLPIVICGARKFAKLRRGFPQSLQDQPIILPTSHGTTRHAIEDTFRTRGIRLNVVGEAQDGELLRLTALRGSALAPLSPSTVAEDIKRNDLVALGSLESVFEEIWLIAAPRFYEHPIVQFLMERFQAGSSQDAA